MRRITIQQGLRALALAALSASAFSIHAARPADPGSQGAGRAGPGVCQPGDLSLAAAACAGYATGNDSAAELLALVGSASWQGLALAGLSRYKDDDSSAGKSSTLLFDASRSAGDATAGALSFLQTINGPFIITLKGGNETAAYLMGQGVAAGTVLSFTIPGDQGAGFSHATVHAPAAAISTPVPEPEAGALMLAGLAALGFIARRRR